MRVYWFVIATLVVSLTSSSNFYGQPKPSEKQIVWEDAQWMLPPTSQPLATKCGDYYAIAIKTQGEWFGTTQYTIRAVNDQLDLVGEVPISLNRSAFLLALITIDTSVYAITDEAQGSELSRALFAHQLSFKEGVIIATTPLDSTVFSIIPTKGNLGKIKEDLEEEVFAFLPQGAVPITETRFNLKQSPNKDYLLVSHSYWSTSELIIHSTLFNKELDKIVSHEMPVQADYTHYGFDIGDEGIYFGCSMDAVGNILIDRYQDEISTLQIAASSTMRADPLIKAKDKDKAILACLSLVKEDWYGVNLMEIDFKEAEVSEQSFTKLEPEFTKSLKLKSIGASLSDYRLLSIDLNEKHEPFLIFQQRFLQVAGVKIDRFSVRRKRAPDFKSIEVFAGPVVLMNFATDLEFRWQYGLQMNYSGKAEEGFAIFPLNFTNLNKAEVDFIFGSSPGSIKEKSGIRLTRLDRYSGVKRKEEVLYPISEGYTWQPYLVIKDSQVFSFHRTQWRGKQAKVNILKIN